MKKSTLSILVFVFIVSELPTAVYSFAKSSVISVLSTGKQSEALSKLLPQAKLSKYGKGYVSWSGTILADTSVEAHYPVLLSRIPSVRNGVPLEISLLQKVPESASEMEKRALSHEEGYWLKVKSTKILLFSRDNAGLARGLVRLAALGTRGGNHLPIGFWADWPSIHLRALHFVISRNVTYQDLRQMVNIAAASEFNTIIALVTPNVGLSTFGELSVHPQITQAQFISFVKYAHESGLNVVPALKLLTHQEKLFGGHYPKLMYNQKTYDPRNPKVYKIVFPIIDQLVKITGAKSFLIGHDEVAGWGNLKANELAFLKPQERPLPANLFLQDVAKLNHHLESLNVKTWMWGDMLLRPNSGTPRQAGLYMHGRLTGYGPAMWPRLSKSIVICNWIYSGGVGNFGSTLELHKAGFPVIGATFKNANNISAYTRFAVRIGIHGMIATTWYFVQRHNWLEIEEIARRSGEDFWNGSGK